MADINTPVAEGAAQTVPATTSLQNTPLPAAVGKKYDWFKSDLAGANGDFPGMYHQGITADHFAMDDFAKYWSNEKLRKPFQDQFGDQAEAKFKETFDLSKKRFELYRDNMFDIVSTSNRTFIGSGSTKRALEAYGFGSISQAKPQDVKVRKTPWGAEEIYRNSLGSFFGSPKHSIEQGAEKNGVWDEDSKSLVPLDDYLETHPDTNLAYAVEADGSPKLIDGLNYLRPLKTGEQLKYTEQIYRGKINSYFGMNGIDTPSNYWLKFAPKNLFNFTADVLDSGAEMMKTLDNFFQKGDASGWDKALTEFQNDVNANMSFSTSEKGRSVWYSTEGLTDGVSQVFLQLMGMVGIAKGVSGLGKLAGMADGTRAGSIASRLWMASLSSDDFIKQARDAGLSPKEQQLFYTLYTAGMYKIAGLSERVIDPVKAKQFARINFERELEPIRAMKAAGQKVTPTGIYQAAKNAVSNTYGSLSKLYKTAITSTSGAASYLAAGATEATEEMSEVVYDKAFKQSINSLYAPNRAPSLYDQSDNRDIRFNVSWDTLGSELAAAGTLGFAGGLIARKVFNPKAFDQNTLLAYGATPGGYDRMERMLDRDFKAGKILPGGRTIGVDGKPVTNVEDSREFMVYKAIKHEINYARNLWESTQMDKAFRTTEDKLAHVTNANLVKQTSIGKDIADKLAEMTQLEADAINEKVSLTPEQQKANGERIQVLKKELEDMKAGNYAAHYLNEGLYNLSVINAAQFDGAMINLPFNRFDKLNQSLTATQQLRQKVTDSDNLSLDDILTRKAPLSPQRAEKLYSALDKKHNVTYDDEGVPQISGDAAKRYNAEKKEIDALVHGGPLGVDEEFLRMADPDGKPTKTFDEILTNEEEREKQSRPDAFVGSEDRENIMRATTDIYDDVDALERVKNSIMERLYQLEMTDRVNPEFNIAAEKGGFEDRSVELQPGQKEAIFKNLINQLGRTEDLISVATENKKSFFNSASKAWNNQLLQSAAALSAVGETIIESGEHDALAKELSPLLTQAMNADADSTSRSQAIAKVEQAIHNYFRKDKKAGIDWMWKKLGLDDVVNRKPEYTVSGKFMYFKSIVNLDPSEFRNSYTTVLNAMKDKRTPFPAQYRNIFISTASLLGGYNPLVNLPTEMGPNSRVDSAPLTESVFVNDEQGSGKTLVMGMAVRTAQVIRKGKTVLFSMDNDLRFKNATEFGEIGVDLDPSVASGMTGEQILGYLSKPENLAELKYIVIDEATLYSRNDIYMIDQRVQEINAGVEDEGRKIKILLAGDEGQLGHIEDGEAYNITGGRIDIDRTTPTRFSFRTGNQDIVAFLKHLRNSMENFRDIDQIQNAVFKYNWETLNGVLLTDDFDKALADFLKKKSVNVGDFVVIAEKERLGAIKQKHSILTDKNLLTPEQAQGKQWKYVMVDIPIDLSKTTSDEKKVFNLSRALSSSGRASEMLIMRNYPALRGLSGPGESIGKAAAFTDEQLTTLRARSEESLVQTGAKEILPSVEPVNRKVEPVERVVTTKKKLEVLPIETRERLRGLLQSLNPKSGHSKFLLHSFYSNLDVMGEEGQLNESQSSPQIQTWKKQLFYPTSVANPDFDADRTQFELRVDNRPSKLLNLPVKWTNKHQLVVWAKLYRGDDLVGEMAIGGISTLDAPNIPNAVFKFSQDQNERFLAELRADLVRAESETTNMLKKGKAESKVSVPLEEFKRQNPYFNYSNKVYHVTIAKNQKSPYQFYSPSLTGEQIDEIIKKKQIEKGLLSLAETSPEKALGGRQILASQLEEFRKMGVFSLPLNGGVQVSLDQFLEDLAKERKDSGKVGSANKLSKAAKENLSKLLIDRFSLGVDKLAAEALRKLERMNVRKMSETDKYIFKKLKAFIRPIGKFKTDEDEATKAKPKEGEVEIPAVMSGLHYHPFLESIYSDSKAQGADAKHAQEFISELKDTIFKYGVYKSSQTLKDSTEPRDVAFGEVAPESVDVANYSSPLLMPEMPVFQISNDLIKSVVNESDVEGYSTIVKTEFKPAPLPENAPEDVKQPEVIHREVDVVSDESGNITQEVQDYDETPSKSSTMKGLHDTWFSKSYDRDYIEEFTHHYRKTIHDNIFRLEGIDAPVVATQKDLHDVIVGLKKQLKERAAAVKLPEGVEPRQLLDTGDKTMRRMYYDYIIAHEFGTLLHEYFPSVKEIGGKYQFTTRSFSFNPMSNVDEISHLESGNDLVKTLLFNTPLLEIDKDGNTKYFRTFSKEEYVRLVRMMRDNNINSLDKARKFFNAEGARTQKDLIRKSMYHRFFAPQPIMVNGKKFHSLITAVSDPVQEEISNNHVTGIITFLASGNENEFIKSEIDTKTGKTKMTGRFVEIEPSKFRADLESSIQSVHEVKNTVTVKNPVITQHSPAKGNKEEGVKISVFVRKAKVDWVIHAGKNGYRITDAKGQNIRTEHTGAIMRAVGLGEISSRFYGRILNNPAFRASLFNIGRYLSQPKVDAPIFRGGEINEWTSFSNALHDLKQTESALGYTTIDGERVELVSLSYPMVRTNQKIQESKGLVGVVATNDLVKENLKVKSYLIKEGFTDPRGIKVRPNRQMTVGELFYNDFNELYLGSLVKAKRGDTSQRIIFNPITTSDKGRDVVALFEADFMPRRGGVLDIERMRKRTVESMTEYYNELGVQVANTWTKALDEVLGMTIPDLPPGAPATAQLMEINKLIATLSPEQRVALVKSDLVPDLMYTPVKEVINGRSYLAVGPIKPSLINKTTRAGIEAVLHQAHVSFKNKAQNYIRTLREPANLARTGLTLDEALDSYFWNWRWVSHNFNTLWVGPVEQYQNKKEYVNMVKRASQISTNRARPVLRDAEWKPGQSMMEGRKMGRFSHTVILSDFSVPVRTVSGGMKMQKVFDGASFFNKYSKFQMQASYGQNSGFNVGANIKPIANSTNPLVGSARYDKYASFEITDQMLTEGHPFIKQLYKKMLSSVTFSTPVMGATNLFDLDQAGKAAGLTEEQIYDEMVKAGVQDEFVREVTFDSSVKTGATHINDFAGDFETFLASEDPFTTVLRDNSEWGLILDASKESNDNEARMASQFVSTFLQTKYTMAEAQDIIGAIAKIGEVARMKMATAEGELPGVKALRENTLRREPSGMLAEIVSVSGESNPLPLSNKMVVNRLNSVMASMISDETIRFKIFGGQQVIAPATGIWQVKQTLEDGTVVARDLRGFDATRGNESIKDTPLWTALNQAIQTKNRPLIRQLRQDLREELSKGGWEVQPIEVVVSPTHFKAFGIPEGTNLEQITPELFEVVDRMKDEGKLFKMFGDAVFSGRDFGEIPISDADRVAYSTLASSAEGTDPQMLMAIAKPYIDAAFAQRKADGKYMKKFEDFQKTLTIIMGRIPATSFQSLAPMKVVGFAHGADNTAYVHPEVLVLQGADHDIDKGNIFSFQLSKNGELTIPATLEEAGNDPILLKNFMVSRMLQGLMRPETMVESTLPTGTDGVDDALAARPNIDDALLPDDPISNNEIFFRGQQGKDNVGIHAAGLKAFSSIFYSSAVKNNFRIDYTPKSALLMRPEGLMISGFDGSPEGLITFSENLQAAVDNAKDPKLGALGINSENGSMVNTLAMFGYTEQQIVAFLTDPKVQAVYNKVIKSQRFFDKRTTVSAQLAAVDENSPEIMQDFKYFNNLAQEMSRIVTVLSVNQEVPNNLWKMYTMQSAFRRLTDIRLSDYIAMSPERRALEAQQFEAREQVRRREDVRQASNEMADEAAESRVGELPRVLNLLQVVNDNSHIQSYLASVDHHFKTMGQSNMYASIMNSAEAIGIEYENQFMDLTEMVYGLAVDEYLVRKPDARNLVMDGQVYDLTKVKSDKTSLSRIDFMRDFPNYFVNMETTSDSALSTAMRPVKIGEAIVLKPEGNLKDYSPEKKSKIKRQMSTVDSDMKSPAGDTVPSDMLFYYSLIKDKGGVSGTQFTDLFEYSTSQFRIFDHFMQNAFDSPYFNSSSAEIKQLFESVYGKDKSEFADQNKLFIPFNNDITVNDQNEILVPQESVVPAKGKGSATVKLKKKKSTRSRNDGPPPPGAEDEIPQSRVYLDEQTRRATSLFTNRKMIANFAQSIGKKLGIKVNVMTSEGIRQEFGQDLAATKGFVKDGVVYINSDLVTIDTPLHEMTHVWLEGFRKKNPEAYQALMKAALEHPYAKRIKLVYPELDDDAVANETFATLTGLRNADKAVSQLNQSFFEKMKDYWDQFITWLNTQFLDIFGVKPSVNDSLLSVIDKVGESLLSSSFMGLSSTDRVALKMLGVNVSTTEDSLTEVRDKLRMQKRFEKIC